MSKPTPSPVNTAKPETAEVAITEVSNTTPPVEEAEATTSPEASVASQTEVQVELSSPAIDYMAAANETLDAYAKNMNRLVHYDRDNATHFQTTLVRLVNDWVKSAKDNDNGEKFFKLGRLLVKWFQSNIDGCTAPELIHRALHEYGSPIRNDADYDRWTTLIGMLYRIDGGVQQAVLKNEKEINDHFKAVAGAFDGRFMALLTEAVDKKRF